MKRIMAWLPTHHHMFFGHQDSPVDVGRCMPPAMVKDCHHLETRMEVYSSIESVSVEVRFQPSSMSIRGSARETEKLSPTIEQIEVQVAPLRTIELAVANATTHFTALRERHAKGQLFPWIEETVRPTLSCQQECL